MYPVPYPNSMQYFRTLSLIQLSYPKVRHLHKSQNKSNIQKVHKVLLLVPIAECTKPRIEHLVNTAFISYEPEQLSSNWRYPGFERLFLHYHTNRYRWPSCIFLPTCVAFSKSIRYSFFNDSGYPAISCKRPSIRIYSFSRPQSTCY